MKTTQLLSFLLLLSLLSLAASRHHSHHHHHHHKHHPHRGGNKLHNHPHRGGFKLHNHPHRGKLHTPAPAPVAAPVFDAAAVQICSRTSKPSFCLDALGPLASSVYQPTLSLMAEFMAEAAIKQTKEIAEGPVRKGIEVCRNSYGTAVEGLQGIVEAMESKSAYDANVYYNRLIGNYEACMKEVVKVAGGSELVKEDQTLREMSSTLLAMVKELYPVV